MRGDETAHGHHLSMLRLFQKHGRNLQIGEGNFPVGTAPPEVQAEVRILKRWNEHGNTAHSLPALHQVRKPFQSPLSAEARAGHASGGQPTDRKRDAVGQLKAPGMPHSGPLKI